MMMNAVGEEYSLGIYEEVLELLTVAVAFVFVEDVLDDSADTQVVFAVLVPVDVASPFRSLAEVIDIFLLLEAEVLPSFYLVPDDAKIGKFVDKVFEVSFLGRFLPALYQ